MSTLYDLFKRRTNEENIVALCNANKIEEIADILLILCGKIDSENLIYLSPKTIEWDGNEISIVEGDPNTDLYFDSPEYVLENKNPDKNSGLFSLGMIAWFLLSGEMFYESQKIHLVDLPELKEKQESLICNCVDSETKEIKLLVQAMEKMTSWDVKRRAQGISYLLKAAGELQSIAELSYVFNDEEVATMNVNLSLRNQIYSGSKGTSVTGLDGKNYVLENDIKISFRPGVHKYCIKVKPGFLKVLVIKEKNPGSKYHKVFNLDGETKEWKLAVIRNRTKIYEFFVWETIPEQQKVLSNKKLIRHVSIPMGTNNEEALLVVRYSAPNEISASLYNAQGDTQISDNEIVNYLNEE